MEYFRHTMIVGAKIKDESIYVKDVYGDVRRFIGEDVIPVLKELDCNFFNDDFNSELLSFGFIKNNYKYNLKDAAAELKEIIDSKIEEQDSQKMINPLPFVDPIDEYDF